MVAFGVGVGVGVGLGDGADAGIDMVGLAVGVCDPLVAVEPAEQAATAKATAASSVARRDCRIANPLCPRR